jgi:hypothetical protein
MMRLAKNALMSALIMLAMLIAVTAQTPRSADDNRNLAPAVGTGGTIGGPTGLFTVYDGATLRRGEYTFSAAYSNFDRDPGDVDITEVPISFQIGLSDHIELFFNTDAYRQVKVNSPRNLSSFYLPNSQLFNTTLNATVVPGAIVLAPQGATSTAFTGTAVYRRAGAPFVQFPFVGGNFGNNGFGPTLGVTSPFLGPSFGFAAGTTPTYGAPIATGDGAALFPGYGSLYGGILPGVVLSTQTISLGTGVTTTSPLAYTVAPSYLPDAPFINRGYGQTAFNTFTVGGKIRFTGPDSPYGIGVIPFYRFYADKADDFAGFNQLQRGASPGANRGDFGAIGFADARLRQWLNVSVNVGYVYNGDVKAQFPSGRFTILDRPDELLYGAALDFPVNKYFQPIAEFRGTRYVGGRTPNAFENHPMDALAGVRIFPRRWFGMGFAYRYNINQQDNDAVEDTTIGQTVRVAGVNGVTVSTLSSSAALGADAFRRSSDPHGFIGQFFIGRRNSRGVPPPVNQVPNVTALNLDSTTVTIPCPPGTESTSGGCKDDASIAVSTVAVDPENDVLTYNYTVSGGRIVGSGANVSWDLTGVQAGTYTITSAVDDGCGVCGTTQTKTVTVASCADCKPICSCPTLSVSGPSAAVKTGEPMTFTANVSGGTQTSVTYNWTVSAGSIISGQGTPSITVDTAGLSGQNVTATVDISGDLCAECPKSDSASGAVETPVVPQANKIDEFGALQNDDIKARADNLAIALQNDPSSTGTIINYGTPAQVRRREALMRTYLTRNRGVDASRLNFVNGGAGDIKTELWVVPAGASQPTPGM